MSHRTKLVSMYLSPISWYCYTVIRSAGTSQNLLRNDVMQNYNSTASSDNGSKII